MADSEQSVIAKLLGKHRNEGHELVEYALVSTFVAIGMILILYGFDERFMEIWNLVANFVLK